MMPQRLATRRFWVRHRGLIGFAILAATTLIALHVALAAASKGEQAHAALCGNRASLQKAIDDSHAYLHMTIAERIRRFGVQFSHVPRTTVLIQIAGYERNLRAYDPLRC